MFVNLKRLLLAVYRIEENQQEIMARLDRLEKRPEKPEPDQWLQDGIAGIMSFQVGGKKRSENE